MRRRESKITFMNNKMYEEIEECTYKEGIRINQYTANVF